MKSKYSRTQYKEEFDIDTATVVFITLSIGKLVLLAYQVFKLYH